MVLTLRYAQECRKESEASPRGFYKDQYSPANQHSGSGHLATSLSASLMLVGVQGSERLYLAFQSKHNFTLYRIHLQNYSLRRCSDARYCAIK